MTPRRWGVGGWLVAGCAFVVAVGGYVGLLVWQPVACGLLTTHAGVAFVVSSARNRNLAAELEAARDRLSAYNASDSRADLAEAPLTPPGGVVRVGRADVPTPIPLVDARPLVELEDPAPPSWMDQSGYRHPACICPWSDDGLRLLARYPACVIHGVRERPLATGGVVDPSKLPPIGDGGCILPTASEGTDGDPFPIGITVQGGPLTDEQVDRLRASLAELPGEDPAEQPFVHTPCGTPISVTDDGEEWCLTCVVEIVREIDCPTCRDTGMVPAGGHGSDGFDRCPDCARFTNPLDAEVWRSGFHGYEGCPAGECGIPFHCSERGDCRLAAVDALIDAPDLDASDGPRSLPTPKVSD